MSAGETKPQMHPLISRQQTLFTPIGARCYFASLINVAALLPHDCSRQNLLLPAAAQSLIQLHQRQQLVAPGLSQAQLRIKEIAIRVESVEQCVDTTLISQISQ